MERAIKGCRKVIERGKKEISRKGKKERANE